MIRRLTVFSLFVFFTSILFAEYKPFYTSYNFLYGTKSLSMGNAFVAVADDLTAIFTNPAGTSKFKAPSFYANYKIESVDYDYAAQVDDFGGYSQEYDYHFTSKLKNINFLAISVPVVFWEVKWNFALGYYRYFPYGYKGHSQSTLTTLNDTKNTQDTRTDFSGSRGIDVLGFTTAFDLTKKIVFGVTIQQFFNSGTIRFDSLPQAPGCKDLAATDHMEGTNYIFGILYDIHKDVTIGFTYHTKLARPFHSEFQCREEGGGKQETATVSEVVIPEKFAIGTGIRLLPSFSLSYEFSRIYWSKGKIGDLAFPVRDDFSFSQTDILNHRFGMEYNAMVREVRIFVRTGVSWDRQLFRGGDDAKVTINGFAFGGGVFFMPGFMLELGYMYRRARWVEAGFFDPQSFIKTTYGSHTLSFGLTYRFGLKPPKRVGRR